MSTTMNDNERIRFLEEELEHLKQEKRAVLDALELAADISNFRTSLNKIDDPLPIIRETGNRVKRILSMRAISFYLVNEEDSDFYQVYTVPQSQARHFDEEMNALIDDKTFAWALKRNKPVIVSSIDKTEKIILHSMNTSSRTRGIFIGILSELKKEILDLSLFLFSITISACSNGLESFYLYKQIKDKNRMLEEHVAELEASRSKLEDEERKYHALFEDSTNSIVLYDRETRKPVDCNHLAHELLGYDRESFMNLRIEDYSFSSLEDIKTRVRWILEKGQASFETRHRKKNGEIIHVVVNGRPITIGGKTYLLTLWNDVTERKRAETERRQLERQLLTAQKMEAVGTLAGGIAHDFNNILGVVQGYGELTLMDLPQTGTGVRRNVESLIKAVDRAKDLVQQILTFSRQGEEEYKSVNVNFIVKETVKLLRATLPASIRIRYDVPAEPVLTLSIPTHIHQVLMNLCTNSLHAMKEKNGQLTVELKTVEITVPNPGSGVGIPDYKNIPPGNYARISVGDTGHGISPSILERVFDPYFTTKEPGEGTGLGLSVVHGILKRYRGHIEIESNVGVGTTVKVFLPTIDAPEKTSEPPLNDLPSGSESILLVDDEIELLETKRRFLTRLNYNVVACDNGHTALKIFYKNPMSYDLIITDMTMPEMNGADLAAEIITSRRDLPIILCTGFSEFIDAKKAKAIGIREYLMKPVNNATLANAVRRVLDHPDVSEEG